MALTPEDVSSKRFTTVRLREGYDMTEVDQFLDEVESELGRLNAELESSRAQVSAVGGGVESPTGGAEETASETGEGQPAPPAVEPPTVAAVSAGTEGERLEVTTTAEASAAATRLMELAGRNADQLVLEARDEAARLLQQAREEADALAAQARSRAEALEAETAERRTALFTGLEAEKSELDAEVGRLRDFEREYRAELRTYFEEQLAALEGQGSGGVLSSIADRPGGPPAAEPVAEPAAEPAGDLAGERPAGDPLGEQSAAEPRES